MLRLVLDHVVSVKLLGRIADPDPKLGRALAEFLALFVPLSYIIGGTGDASMTGEANLALADELVGLEYFAEHLEGELVDLPPLSPDRRDTTFAARRSKGLLALSAWTKNRAKDLAPRKVAARSISQSTASRLARHRFVPLRPLEDP